LEFLYIFSELFGDILSIGVISSSECDLVVEWIEDNHVDSSATISNITSVDLLIVDKDLGIVSLEESS